MGEWSAVNMGSLSRGALPYDHAVQFKSIIDDRRSASKKLSLGGTTCMFTEEDANTIADILNKQQEAATQYCVDLVRKKNELI
jgi:hypothetical protein